MQSSDSRHAPGLKPCGRNPRIDFSMHRIGPVALRVFARSFVGLIGLRRNLVT
jgi:hypothetical protein